MPASQPIDQQHPDEPGFLERKFSHLRKRAAQRRELTRRLREKYRQCLAIVEHLKDGIFVETVRGEILDANAAAGRMLGYSRQELLTMTVGDLVPPEVAATLPETIQERTVREGVYVETVNLRKDGSQVPVEVSNTLIELGGEKRVIAIVHDITQRIENRKKLLLAYRELENKVRERTEELDRANRELRAEHRLFIGGPTVVLKWKAAPGWPVEYVSPNIESQFGYPPQIFARGEFLFETIIHPEDRTRIAGEINNLINSGHNSYEQVYRIANRDGQYRWVSDFTVVNRGTDGEITHYHGYVLDITARRTNEEELRRHREHLEELVEKRTAELTGMVDAMARRVVKTSDLEITVERLKKQLRGAGLTPDNGDSPASDSCC